MLNPTDTQSPQVELPHSQIFMSVPLFSGSTSGQDSAAIQDWETGHFLGSKASSSNKLHAPKGPSFLSFALADYGEKEKNIQCSQGQPNK